MFTQTTIKRHLEKLQAKYDAAKEPVTIEDYGEQQAYKHALTIVQWNTKENAESLIRKAIAETEGDLIRETDDTSLKFLHTQLETYRRILKGGRYA